MKLNVVHEWCSSSSSGNDKTVLYLFVSSPVLLSNLNKWCWHVREWRRDIRDGVWQIVRCFCQPLKIQISNPRFCSFFNSSPPPSPFSKSAERISTFSANFQQLVEIYCFCTAFVYSHITFISIFEQKVGRVRSGRWQQMDTVFPPQKFFICRCEERNTTEPLCIPHRNLRKCFLCAVYNDSITHPELSVGESVLFIKNLFAP